MTHIDSNLGKQGQKKAILLCTALLGWMVFIFAMSAQPGDESGDLSGGITHMLVRIVNGIFSVGWSEAAELEVADMIHLPIRKIAHMTEYGVLAVLWYGTCKTVVAPGVQSRKRNSRITVTGKAYGMAWILTVCYAVTDEIHQIFVPGRSGNLIDVVIDALGAFLALLIFMIVIRVSATVAARSNNRV